MGSDPGPSGVVKNYPLVRILTGPSSRDCTDNLPQIIDHTVIRIQSHSRIMLVTVFFSLLSLGLFGGCSDPSSDGEILPDSILALVLADLHLAGAELQLDASRDSLLLASLADGTEMGKRDSILGIYHLTEASFNQALEPYIEDPSNYVALYSLVLDRLNLLRQDHSLEVSGSEDG